ncbi:MAG: choice-of-anchor tandem repeat NxxGxxAF-containing protein [Phycisphaeraceae bacterium]
MNFRRPVALLLAGTSIGLSTPQAQGVTSTTPILSIRALSDTDGPLGPGLGPGITFRVLDLPAINDAGQWAAVGLIRGPGIDSLSDRGIWSANRGGSAGLLVRSGDAAPNAADGVRFQNFEDPQISETGTVVFNGALYYSVFDPPGPVDSTNNTGYWSVGPTGPTTQIVREGDPIPNNPGFTFSNFSGVPAINGSGQVAFNTRVGDKSSIWTNASGALAEVARRDQQLPGFAQGAEFFLLFRPHLTDAGEVIFQARIDGNTIDFRNEDGIWSDRAGTLAPRMRTGEPAPGTPAGTRFIDLSLGSPLTNAAGDFVFQSELIGTGVNPDNDRGIWSNINDDLRLVARKGDPAPGTEPGVVFEGFSVTDFDDDGFVAINGALTGPGVDGGNYLGVWSDVGGNGLQLVAREDQPAPGTTGDARFSEFGGAFLGGDEQVAFFARLKGGDVTDPTRVGLWATDPRGDLRLILRQGDLLDVDPTTAGEDLRRVTTFGVIEGDTALNRDDRGGGGFNSAGEIAIRVSFDDGTNAIYIATVPEPNTLALLGMAGLLITRRTRRH